MQVIFVSSPYTLGDVSENVQRQVEMAHRLMDYGFAPIAPLLSHYLELWRSRPWEEWMEVDLELVSRCDALLRLEGESRGADMEVAEARRLGIPVYFDFEALTQDLGGG